MLIRLSLLRSPIVPAGEGVGVGVGVANGVGGGVGVGGGLGRKGVTPRKGWKGGSPASWKDMKLVPQLLACTAVQVVPTWPSTVVPAAMAAASKTKLLPLTEMFLVPHWQPSKYDEPSG